MKESFGFEGSNKKEISESKIDLQNNKDVEDAHSTKSIFGRIAKKAVLGSVFTGMAMGTFAKNQEQKSDAEILREGDKNKIENTNIGTKQKEVLSFDDDMYLYKNYLAELSHLYGKEEKLTRKKEKRLLEMNKYFSKYVPYEDIGRFLNGSDEFYEENLKLAKKYHNERLMEKKGEQLSQKEQNELRRFELAPFYKHFNIKDNELIFKEEYIEKFQMNVSLSEALKMSNEEYKDFLSKVENRCKNFIEFRQNVNKKLEERREILSQYSDGVNPKYFQEKYVIAEDRRLNIMSDEYFEKVYIPIIKRVYETEKENKRKMPEYKTEPKAFKIEERDSLDKYSKADKIWDEESSFRKDGYFKGMLESDKGYKIDKREDVVSSVYNLMPKEKHQKFEQMLNSPEAINIKYNERSFLEIGSILNIYGLSDLSIEDYFENQKDKNGRVLNENSFRRYFKDANNKIRCLEVVKDYGHLSYIVDGELIRYDNIVKYRDDIVVFSREDANSYTSILGDVGFKIYSSNNVTEKDMKFVSNAKEIFEQKANQIRKQYGREPVAEKMESKDVTVSSEINLNNDERLHESPIPKMESKNEGIPYEKPEEDLASMRKHEDPLQKMESKKVKVYSPDNSDMSLMKVNERQEVAPILDFVKPNTVPIDAMDSLGHFSNRKLKEGLNSNNNYMVELETGLKLSKDFGLYLDGKGVFDLILDGNNGQELIIGHVDLDKGAFIYNLPNDFEIKKLNIFTENSVTLDKIIPCLKIKDKDGKVVPIPVDLSSEGNESSDNYYASPEEFN